MNDAPIKGGRDDFNRRLDLDEWLPWIAPLTFQTVSLPLNCTDAKLILQAYEHRRNGARPEDDPELGAPLDALAKRLDEAVQGGAFVRLSKRSGKDASNGDTRLAAQYVKEREEYSKSEPSVTLPVADMIAIVRALATLLKVESGMEAVLQLSSSQRIFQDLTMAMLQIGDAFHTEMHVRKFAPILPELEFRGFVCHGNLTGLSQYLSICYVPRIAREKDQLVLAMQSYFIKEVKPRVPITEYVVDFAFLRDGSVKVIELNPFSRATHAALFDWDADDLVLHGKKPFEARIVASFDPACALRLAGPIVRTLTAVRADVPPPPSPVTSSASPTSITEEAPARTCIIS